MAYPLTEQGYIRLLQQLGQYESLRELILQDQVSTAHGVVMGESTSLSPELAEKRQRLAVINERIKMVRMIINDHYILKLPVPEEGKITIGSVVTLTYPDNTEADIMLFDILPESIEELDMQFPGVKVVSLTSPIGSALFNCEEPLMSAQEGDEITVKLPKGDVKVIVTGVYTPTVTKETLKKERRVSQRRRS